MPKKPINLVPLVFLATVVSLGATSQAQTAKPTPYPVAAPLDQYFIPAKASEIELARSAAPASISGGAEVLVLTHDGYTSAVKGGNGFVCLVERSFAAATDDPVFWNPKIRGPVCMNAPAARTFLPTVVMKAKLAIAGKSKTEIAQAIRSAMDKKVLPALEPNAMSYMLSKQQYLNDEAKAWHPHMMWFVPGDADKSWGANLPGSPSFASDDHDARLTILMVAVGNWSDGTPAPHAGN